MLIVLTTKQINKQKETYIGLSNRKKSERTIIILTKKSHSKLKVKNFILWCELLQSRNQVLLLSKSLVPRM